MNKFIITVALAFMPFLLTAQDCDCTIVPYNPKSCFEPCVSKILRTATANEFQLFIGLPEGLTNKILQQRNLIDPSLENLEKALTEEEYSTLVDKFTSINQKQNNYFNTDLKERSKINKEIRKLEFERNKNPQ